MGKTVVAMFESRPEAEQAARILQDEGFGRREIDLRSSDWSPTPPQREETGASQGWWDWLFGESEDRSDYTEALRRGAAVLSVCTTDDRAELARVLLESLGGDVEEEEEDAGETLLLDERSSGGPRPIVLGVVRIYTWVGEDVGDLRASLSASEEHERDFRRHWQSAGSDLPYEDWRSAYDFGHALGGHPRYSAREWASVEPDARRGWEERNPGTWDRFKDAIQYAWDRVRGTGRRAA
jgi:hypothetical protein